MAYFVPLLLFLMTIFKITPNSIFHIHRINGIILSTKKLNKNKNVHRKPVPNSKNSWKQRNDELGN